MNINIYGSTGIIGSKTLNIIKTYFPNLKINLLSANNNVNKLIKQSFIFNPKYIFINNQKKIDLLQKNANPKCKILNLDELKSNLKSETTNYSILAVSGYRSLDLFDLIIKNTSSLGLVSKEAIVSAGHLFKKYPKTIQNKIYPIDSEHFSIFKYLNNNKMNIRNLETITLTASGGPFFGKNFFSLKNVSFKQATKHPKWNMGYKNSIDSATLSNKCLELVEAHYLFNIPFNKLKVIVHPESKVHSIFEYRNYLYNMIMFHNDMAIPIFHFLNQKFNNFLQKNIYSLSTNSQFNFFEIKNNHFPIYKFFENLDKSNPSNIIKFNVANEYAVDLFKNNLIKYTDIYKIIVKITSLNLNYNLKNINNVIEFHKILERKISEKIPFN